MTEIQTETPSDSIDEAQSELIEDFSFFDDWMDRYQHIIELGRDLPDFPREWQAEENRLHGCQSQVWLVGKWQDGRLHMAAISDAAIVSGLIAILMRIYNHRTADEIVNTPPNFISAIGLDDHLSPTRSNGLNAMLGAIFTMAKNKVGRGTPAAA
jgi:cysteine desulfuration protein SufE